MIQKANEGTGRWLWDLLGFLSAFYLGYIWIAVLSRRLPVPTVSGGTALGSFFAFFLLSGVAGWRGSKRWFVVTAGFVVTLLLLWIGEAIWEAR